MIQVISDLVYEKLFIQEENHVDYLIWVNQMTHFKRLRRLVKAQAMTIEQSQICVSQQYCLHMIIETEWKDLR